MNCHIRQNIDNKWLIETEVSFCKILEIHFEWSVNEHAELIVKGMLNHVDLERVKSFAYLDTKVNIVSLPDGEIKKEKILFCGLIQSVRQIKDGDFFQLEIKAKSASILMDQKFISCSFQNSLQSYADLVNEIVKTTGGKVICTAGEATSITRPLICYQETAWEYVRRMSSHLGSCIVAEAMADGPKIWFGMKLGRPIDRLSIEKMSVEIEKQYHENEQGEFKLMLQIQDNGNYSIGDWHILEGRRYIITRKTASFLKGSFEFFYDLVEESTMKQRICFNPKFTGLSLAGVVEDRRGESVAVRFEIDQKQGLYFYPWKPETGNGVYAVPEIGTTVRVYFKDCDERNGIAIHCIRSTDNKNAMKSDTHEKVYDTPDGSKMELKAGAMGLTQAKKDGRQKMFISDSSGIKINGDQTISILADGNIKLQAGKIEIDVLSEIKADAQG